MNHLKNRPFSGVSTEMDTRKIGITRNRTIKKKCKRTRTVFTTHQLRTLEKTFLLHKYIKPENRRELSKNIKLSEQCIKVWFQNRRMKNKRESSISSDPSSETFKPEVTSPMLVRQPESEHDQRDNKYKLPYQESSYYQSPDQTNNALQNVSEPTKSWFVPRNDYGNGLTFCIDTNLFPELYPLGESEVYVYQNQYQHGNDLYNWYPNNMESCLYQ